MAIKCMIVPVTPYQQNCTVLWDDATMIGAVVDPGGEIETILHHVKERGVTLEKILLTHGHIDHAAGAGELAQVAGIPIEGPHLADKFLIDALPEQTATRPGFAPSRPFTPDRWLVGDDEAVTVGELSFTVRHCPGHTPGHVIFFHAPANIAIVGDVLFQGSVGRTDLPGGDHDQLVRSIREQLWPLGDDIAFIPGHGPPSTFGEERRSNPFVADRKFR